MQFSSCAVSPKRVSPGEARGSNILLNSLRAFQSSRAHDPELHHFAQRLVHVEVEPRVVVERLLKRARANHQLNDVELLRRAIAQAPQNRPLSLSASQNSWSNQPLAGAGGWTSRQVGPIWKRGLAAGILNVEWSDTETTEDLLGH